MFRMEREFHESQADYTKCLKNNLGTSKVTMKAVKDGKDHYSPSKWEKAKKWLICGIQLLFSATLFVADVVSDSILVIKCQFYQEFCMANTRTFDAKKCSFKDPNIAKDILIKRHILDSSGLKM